MLYHLNDAIEQVGVYPQVTDATWTHSQREFSKANRELDPELNNSIPAPTLIIRPGAKITDALSVVPVSWPFLTVNDKLLHFLQGVRRDPLRIMPVTAIKKGISYPYWLTTIDVQRLEYVNYADSRFILTEIKRPSVALIISNAEEYSALLKKYSYPKRIYATKLVLNTSVIQHDIFRLPHFTNPRYIVSERFREGVEQANITGLRFDPIEPEQA